MEVVGKTVASVESKQMIGRDLHYKEEVWFERVTLIFTDGTQVEYDLLKDELDATTIMERERVCPSCNQSFDVANIKCWLEDLHWRPGKTVPPGRVMLLAGHRQSGDNPDSFGPFDDIAEAREYAIEQVRDGDWDADGVTIEFSPVTTPVRG